jgi:hypothetical protein
MRPPVLLTRSFAYFVCVFVLGLGMLLPQAARAADAKDGQIEQCPSCRGDGVCRARDCKEGKIPCYSECLKPDAPEWTKRQIEGQSEADAEKLWFPYVYKVSGKKETAWFGREQAGELIAIEKGQPVSRGRCPGCAGSGRIVCQSCAGSGKCFACLGEGKFTRGRNLLTLTDALQGREMEAVVRSRTAESVTVLRLADLKVFEIPLDKLSAESNELLAQRFPLAP